MTGLPLKISIVTVCYNASSSIEETILSVMSWDEITLDYQRKDKQIAAPNLWQADGVFLDFDAYVWRGGGGA